MPHNLPLLSWGYVYRLAIGVDPPCVEIWWKGGTSPGIRRDFRLAGESIFVDWAGATIPVYDRHRGGVWRASLFVAALGASSYTWADATRDQQMEAWLKAHMRAFERFQGIPELAVPDNCKTGVTKAHRYDPGIRLSRPPRHHPVSAEVFATAGRGGLDWLS